MDLQTYIRNYGSSYSTKADKRDLIRQRHTPTRHTTRYERVLGTRTAQDPTRYLRAKVAWKILGRNLGDAIRNDSAQDALEVINDNLNLGRARWRDTLDSLFSCETFCECHDCDYLFLEDDMRSVYDGDYSVCENCRDSNYHYSDRRDTYVSDDDREDEDAEAEENERDSVIGEYHSSKHDLGHIPSKYDDRKTRVLLGLELEMEISEGYDRHDKARELLGALGYHTEAGAQYALCEQDGSLDCGFEMVTGYTGLDVHAHQLAFFKQRFAGAKSHNTRTCGLHVHVCKAGMSLLHASKLVLFINDEKNHDLIKTIARRTESSYSVFKDKSVDKSWIKDAVRTAHPETRATQPDDNERDYRNGSRKRNALRNLNSSRYEALNFNNEKTVEFRLFKGTLKYSTLMACLEFAFISWFFARDTSQTQLTTANFLQYICLENNRRDTRYLREYLTDKGYTLPFKPKTDTRRADQLRAGNIVLNKIETVSAKDAPSGIRLTGISTINDNEEI